MSDSRWLRVSDNDGDPDRRAVEFVDLARVQRITIRQVPPGVTGVAAGFYVEFDGVRTVGPFADYDGAEDLVGAVASPYFPDLPS